MTDDERDIRALLEAEAERSPRPQGLRNATIRRGMAQRIGVVALPLLVVTSVAWVAIASPFSASPEPNIVGPGPEAEDGLIAFTTQKAGEPMPWIAVVPASGGEATRLREGSDPSWSSDGTQIAFSCYPSVCTMNADGSDVDRITDPPEGAIDEDPDWGPDHRILFTRSYLGEPGRGPDIFVTPFPNKTEQRIGHADGDDSQASWSPDGKHIAFIRGLGEGLEAPTGGFQLLVANDDGGQTRQLTTDGASRPDWSPDGRTILFDQASALWTITIDGGEPTKLPVVSGRSFDVGSFPAWAPDSQRIAFMCSSDGSDNNDICLGDIGSEEWTAVVATNENEASPAWQPETVDSSSAEDACASWAAEVTSEAQVRALRWTGSSQEVRRATVGWERMLKSASSFLDRDGNTVVRPAACVPDKGVFLLKAQLGDVSVDATLEVDTHGKSVCLSGEVIGARAAHLHFDDPSKSDPVILTLFEPPNNFAQQCVIDALSTSEAQQVLDRPLEYFVDFHPDEPSLPLEIPLTQNGSRNDPPVGEGRANCHDPSGDLMSEGSGDQSGPDPQSPEEKHPGTDLTGFSMARSQTGAFELTFSTVGDIPRSLAQGESLHLALTADPEEDDSGFGAITATLRGDSWMVTARDGDAPGVVLQVEPELAGAVLNLIVEPAYVPTLMRGTFRWHAFSE